jgi:hypothetical protein
MLRGVVLTAILIDIGLVAARVLTQSGVFALPGFTVTIGWLALSFAVAAAFIIGSVRSGALSRSLRFATATGVGAGCIMIGHMALENFGARVGEDARLTIAAMLAIFALWFGSGWRASRTPSTLIAGAVVGCWTALVSVILAVTPGFIGMYFDVPSSAYVATWPEYIRSRSGDPQAFAIANTLDSATSHLAVALLLGSILGGAGWCAGSMRRRDDSHDVQPGAMK